MILKILITVLVLQQTLSQQPLCPPVQYTLSYLVLTWPPEFCYLNSQCNPNWRQMWDGKSMTIHGYWPSYTSYGSNKCYDKQCLKKYPFNFDKFSHEEQTILNSNWPNLKQTDPKNKSFLKHEWNKHGTCYLFLQHNGTRVTLSDDDIFREYMLGTVEKKLELNITLENRKFQTKEELSQRIGISSENYFPICQTRKGGIQYLSEIRVCYSLDSPGHEQIIQCPVKGPGSTCKFQKSIIVR